MTVKEFLTRYDNGEDFNEADLHDLYWGDVEFDGEEPEEIETIYGEKGRWSRYEEKVWKIGSRYFIFTADIGLTEYQDNDYNYQPTEVYPVEKIVTITEWVEK